MAERGYRPDGRRPERHAPRQRRAVIGVEIDHGAVVIAAITSCTNTSNPSVMVGAGLLAKKAVERGPDGQALRQDQHGPRLQGRHRIPDQVGPAAVPRAARLQHRRLRLHHLHRQQRARCPSRWTRRCITEGNLVAAAGPLRQPQLRRPRQPARQGQLPGLAAAGGGLRPGRHHRHRPDQRAARHRQGRPAGLPARHLAQPEGSRGPSGSRSIGRDVPKQLRRTSSTATRPGTPSRSAAATCTRGTRRLHLHPGAALLRGPDPRAAPPDGHPRRARAGAASATPSPPTTSRPPATSPRTARPAAT